MWCHGKRCPVIRTWSMVRYRAQVSSSIQYMDRPPRVTQKWPIFSPVFSHRRDVLSIAFCNAKSCPCKYSVTDDCHIDWLSTVMFSPSLRDPVIVSTGWGKIVKAGILETVA
ncbi:hypothetical protein KIN20_031976 [Parelaphostrongylus tenuis]|uniref:Uncharacterized protein n=1 Tax=Parelaphostrongylus tenuis TaxID=148309 RepID=A0AAD5WI52_PARTN|nr:hypothetical protein KIN20_031976 [Parelaphostrongylus tenuis]